MRFNLVTLFPEFFESPLSCGLMAKGADSGVVDFNFVNPRDFTQDRHRTVDDRPYGGGPGMVMMCDPVAKALDSIEQPGRILYMSPRGRKMDQQMARELSLEESVTIICGRYEGIDQRLLDIYPIEEVSVGDFVLNGGESAAVCVVESIARLVPEFMGHEDSGDEESFSSGLLEYPHYTRPVEFRGHEVPKILMSGDHGRIAQWRHEQSLSITLQKRPDMLSGARLSRDDIHFLRKIKRKGVGKTLGKNLFLSILHAPVLNKFGQTVAVSLTNLDVHDIARVSRTCGLGGYYIATPLTDQRKLLDTLIGHWLDGPGSQANKDRKNAIGTIRAATDLEEIIQDVTKRTGQRPTLVATSARGAGSVDPETMRDWLEDRPVLLILGTAHGLAPEILEQADGIFTPVRSLSPYNHLSVRSATAMMIDRILGDTY